MEKRFIILICILSILFVIMLGGFEYYNNISNNSKQSTNISNNTSSTEEVNTQKEDQEKTENTKSTSMNTVNTSTVNGKDKIDKKTEELEKEYQAVYYAYNNRDYKTTIKLADALIKKDPTFFKAYNIKGIAQCFSSDFNNGMKNIDKALEINPNYAYGRFDKALAYELYNKFDSALVWYNKALELEKFEWSYYGIASIYGRRGDVENTIKYLKIAIDIKPEIKETAKEEKDFNPVKNSKKFKELVSN